MPDYGYTQLGDYVPGPNMAAQNYQWHQEFAAYQQSQHPVIMNELPDSAFAYPGGHDGDDFAGFFLIAVFAALTVIIYHGIRFVIHSLRSLRR